MGTDVLPRRPRPALIEQPSLFGFDPPGFDPGFASLERRYLGFGAWVDHAPGWVRGHEALFASVVDAVAWEQNRRPMYDRIVDVPRLTGSLAPDRQGDLPLFQAMADALGARYGTRFERLGFALYRDGRDSVAWHGDQVARELPEALVATVSLGEPRLFALRPKGGGRAVHYHLGHGDLVVMGGTCQRTWDHAVPKVARAGPRVTVMFRPAWASRFSQALPEAPPST